VNIYSISASRILHLPWNIQNSALTPQFECRIVSCLRGLDLHVENVQVTIFTLDGNGCSPVSLARGYIPDAFEFAASLLLLALVLRVLEDLKIAAAVVSLGLLASQEGVP